MLLLKKSRYCSKTVKTALIDILAQLARVAEYTD